MRNPLRTEGEAFSFVLAVAAVFLVVGIAGALAGLGAGVAAFVGALVGVAVGVYLGSEPKVREPAVWERPRGDPPGS